MQAHVLVHLFLYHYIGSLSHCLSSYCHCRGKAKAPSPPVEAEDCLDVGGVPLIQELEDPTAPGHRYQNAQFGYTGESVNVRPYAIALHSFVPQFENELAFSDGDMVFLTRKVDADWVHGEFEGQSGIFPSSYVNIVVDVSPKSHLEDLEFLSLDASLCSTAPESAALGQLAPNSLPSLQAGDTYRVAHSFTAETPTDVSLTAGELVVIICHTEENWTRYRIPTH